MIDVIEKLPDNNSICVINTVVFDGAEIEALFVKDEQIFITIESGLRLKASDVIEWKLKVI